MTKRLKLIICTLLAAIFPFIYSVPAFAWSQIDLSRVKFSSGEEELVFRFGGLEVYGKLRQVAPFTEEQINTIVLETIHKTGLDEADLYEAQKKIEKARSYSEITPEEIEQLKEDLYTTMGVVPGGGTAAAILKAIDGYMNSSSWDDVGTTSTDLLDSSVSDWVKDTATGFIEKTGTKLSEKMIKVEKWRGQLASIYTFCNMLADKYAQDRQKWKDIAEGAHAKRLLNEFYQKLQEGIDEAMDKSDKKGWEIDFDSKGGTEGGSYTEREFAFFGVEGNKQTWYLDMHLAQTATNEFGSVLGIYKGNFNMKADHDMSSFTSKAHEAARNMEHVKSMLKAYENDENYKAELSLSSEGSAKIERTIAGSCEAVIDKSGEISLTLNEQSDETYVEFSGIAVDMDITAISKELGSVASLVIPFEIGNEEQSVKIMSSSLNVTSLVPGSTLDNSFYGSDSADEGWDEEIWRHWDGSYADKELSHIGR